MLALALIAAVPRSVFSQQPQKFARIGYAGTGTPISSARNLQAFWEGLRKRGRVEGKNVVIDYRFSHGNSGLFPALVAKLVRLDPDCLPVVGASAIRGYAIDQDDTHRVHECRLLQASRVIE